MHCNGNEVEKTKSTWPYFYENFLLDIQIKKKRIKIILF